MLWLAEPERDAALPRAKGHGIGLMVGMVQVHLEWREQVKEVLAAVMLLM